mmetsp:Transcript_37822/g.106269  ORF Transcript_37822/g.106269 Transcript_37822/m.106269 type:complete len:524 (-) Transcript_37822:473-2044(-)
MPLALPGAQWRWLVGLLGALPSALADLPVHCVRHQVVGEWRFKLGPLEPTRSSCGHLRPDTEEGQPSRGIVDGSAGGDQLMVTLRDPNVALTARDSRGSWTMIYDEGFEVNVAGMNFFAFSNFTFEVNATHPTVKHNSSHCGDTMVGWYQNADRTRFGCYYGSKVLDETTHHELSAVQPRASQAVAPKKRPPVNFDNPLSEQGQKAAVSKLNNKIAMLQLGWKARTMPRWNGRTMREINSYAGLRRPQGAREMRRQMLEQHAPRRARSFLQRRAGESFPTVWDWSAAFGKDYLEPVMDQADCGSCYAASSMRMLTSRHKIRQNDTEALPWSINFPLFCSEYNQGCDGGYGFLESKWAEDVGLVPESCAPFSDQADGACQALDDCDLGDRRYRAVNHRYVGGFYGGSDHEHIRRELVSNGPLVLSFEPKEDFMYYRSGLYRSGSNKIHQEWEQVDHAVLLIGLGEEEGHAYWVLQNSWGTEWGEQGYFRMARGIDESGCESIAVAADVARESSNDVLDSFLASL